MSVAPQSSSTAPQSSGARKALGDSAITMAERVIAQASQFAVFIFAARMLSPAEFGVFALASALAILLLRAAEVAWAPYIMAWSGDATRPRQVLLLSVLCGVAVALLGQVAAGIADMWAAEARIGALIHLFSFWVMLATVSSAQKGIMVWQHKLKLSALCEILSELAGLAVALTALWYGYGIFALVFGRLAAQSVHLVASFCVTRMTPLPGISRAALAELWRFSAQIFTSRMIANIRLYLATFVIGGFLGPVAVGLFRAADRLVVAFAELLMVPGYLMAWTQFRAARDAGPAAQMFERIRQRARVFYKVLFAAGLPMMAWLILMSDDIIAGLLSEEWAAATPLVAILALARLTVLPSVSTEPLLSITDQARRLPLVTTVVFVFSLVVTLVSAQFGLYAVTWAQLVIGLGSLGISLAVYQRYAKVAWSDVLGGIPALLGPLALGVAALWLFDRFLVPESIPPLARAIGGGLVALMVYLGALRLLDPGFLAGLRKAAPEPSATQKAPTTQTPTVSAEQSMG